MADSNMSGPPPYISFFPLNAFSRLNIIARRIQKDLDRPPHTVILKQFVSLSDYLGSSTHCRVPDSLHHLSIDCIHVLSNLVHFLLNSKKFFLEVFIIG